MNREHLERMQQMFRQPRVLRPVQIGERELHLFDDRSDEGVDVADKAVCRSVEELLTRFEAVDSSVRIAGEDGADNFGEGRVGGEIV
jgi:hypothetical protein